MFWQNLGLSRQHFNRSIIGVQEHVYVQRFFSRIQFYSETVPPVVCDWDTYKDRVLGTDSSLSEKDEEVKQKQGLNNE